MAKQIDLLLQALVKYSGSDLHLSSGSPPVYRIHGEFQTPQNGKVFDNQMVTQLTDEIMESDHRTTLVEMHDVDFSYHIDGCGRFRVNVFEQINGRSAVFRAISSAVPTFEELRLPDALRQLASMHKGLVLVTGPTGSGKSTTQAAIINLINSKRQAHILTIEDPIEFVHTAQRSLINQREVGAHAHSFARALRAALREDPDVILVGEMRDPETIKLALTAAETGHLVFATLHTNSAAKAIDRIIDSFESEQQAQVRAQLAETLKAVVAQQLLMRIDKSGRVGAYEIMFVNAAIATGIKDGKTGSMQNTMSTSRKEGMCTMDGALSDLVKAKAVTLAEAKSKANDPAQLDRLLQG